MTTVGLDPAVADRYPGQLSGGQAQRVGVARALAAEPNILLMDEPFGAVDPIVRADLQRELIRLQQELDKTVVFVTHDIDEAFLLGDQIVILENEGVVAQAGTPNEIIETPANDFVAALTGTTDGSRSLRIRRTATAAVVVDASGRTRGVLDEDDLR
jgi:osmoprotectant transport system ATP-binding protein